MTFDIALHELCVRVGGRAGGRAGVLYVITKFFLMVSLPNFLTHGAPLKCMAKSCVDDTKLLISFDLKEETPTIAHLEEDLFNVRKLCCQN